MPTTALSPVPYFKVVRAIQSRHGIRVKRWRKTMTGCAWQAFHPDGRTVNWIEAPVPRTPISLAIFLHEVGHHAIGFDRYKRRCEEEYHAWVWALDQMRAAGVLPDVRVNRRFESSMRYAVDKAVRRGIKTLPGALDRFRSAAA